MALKRKYHEVQNENEEYRELFEFIRNRPAPEAQAIFNRIRTSQNPFNVLRSIKEADILIPHSISSASGQPDPRQQKLNQEALESAPIKVHARAMDHCSRGRHRV